MKSTILLPLYIYPHPGAWDPLYAAIFSHPGLSFLIIVNPHSGPGAAPWWPNEDYVREIPRLNAHDNVQTVGYVRATYCQRPITEIFQDVGTYATREVNGDKLPFEVQGIFVDETVNVFSPDIKQYLDEVDGEVKGTKGIGDKRIVIHNPGTAVNSELATPGPDITVVVETSYDHFITKEYQDWLETSPYDRSRTCYMLYSVPVAQVENLTVQLSNRAQYLFVTSATANVYDGFNDASWNRFVRAMAAT